MFDKATRMKLRYDTSQGRLSVEDLWDLPLITNTNKLSLDLIARDLHTQLKNAEDISFVIKGNKTNEVLQLKFDIVKYVIDVKLVEKEQQEQAKLNKDKKQQILDVISKKENEQLSGFSLEELKKMADNL